MTMMSLSMSTMLRMGNLWFLLSASLLLASAALANDQQCERLKATLTYTQEEAPRDLSGLVRSHRRGEEVKAPLRLESWFGRCSSFLLTCMLFYNLQISFYF
jgi:hypothetical protein